MDDSPWFLMKNEDGTIFGPVGIEQLKTWAEEAQISPLDKVSNDEVNWVKAPMIAELAMDYLIEVGPDLFYGPTHIGAVRAFIEDGDIGPSARITNCKDGSESILSDVPELMGSADDDQPTRTSIRVNVQQRIRDLEQALDEERRLREIAEHTIEKLEARLAQKG